MKPTGRTVCCSRSDTLEAVVDFSVERGHNPRPRKFATPRNRAMTERQPQTLVRRQSHNLRTEHGNAFVLATVRHRNDTTACIVHHFTRTPEGQTDDRQAVRPSLQDHCSTGVVQAREQEGVVTAVHPEQLVA